MNLSIEYNNLLINARENHKDIITNTLDLITHKDIEDILYYENDIRNNRL